MVTENPKIDYFKLAHAIDFYKSQGFEYIELPWTSPQGWYLTSPVGAQKYKIDNEPLVASAEQSFIDLLLASNLGLINFVPGRYVACTPCFRDDEITKLHRRYFMKVELIDTLNISSHSLDEIIHLCKRFFETFLPVKIVKTNDENKVGHLETKQTFDILTKDTEIELGSYGIRHAYDQISWVYATGCAEPRLSTAIELHAFGQKMFKT